MTAVDTHVTRLVDLLVNIPRHQQRQNIVELAHMCHRVLAGRRLQRHRSTGGDEPIDTVAATDLAIIPHLGTQAHDSEIQA